jgi:hypothetical protein
MTRVWNEPRELPGNPAHSFFTRVENVRAIADIDYE